ncbi:hypothetical protein BKA69DRAFT_1082487 [Paraphysoderma sedebokerense]|nr:hypothetical protein BKA69DRAFT_1082487 [Paraphysoderma sedebokerense]
MPDLSPDVVCIIGVGYVGEQLLQTFSRSYPVIGYDISETRLEYLRKTYSSLSNVILTNNPDQVTNATVYLVSVPTPLTEDMRDIETTYLESALDVVEKYAQTGNTVVVESSVAVGMTREFFGHLAEMGIFVGFSPERVDPGRIKPNPWEIPKIISGIDEQSKANIFSLYSRVFDKLVAVKSLETAEMTKLFENCFRMVNIAYVNEMADACAQHGVDATEVVNAASTKPFGYMPFYHSAGVGGHCIPVNPYYLFLNNRMPLLEFATKQTKLRPMLLGRKLIESYPSANRICIVGMGFKPGQSLMDHSPSITIASVLQQANKNVSYYDPLVKESQLKWLTKLPDSEWNESSLRNQFDLIIVMILQKNVDFSVLASVNDFIPVEILCSGFQKALENGLKQNAEKKISTYAFQ